MEWSDLLKLLHVAIAFAFVTGLAGRSILLRRAASATEVEDAYGLSQAAAPFEQLVVRGSMLILPAGLLTAWAQGYPWAGLTTGWMLAATVLLLLNLPLVPLVFLPGGRRFEAAMTDARASGSMTPGLVAAFADPAVRAARMWEVASVALIIVLMVLKPF